MQQTTNRLVTTYDPAMDSIPFEIVSAVADVQNCAIESLPPLYQCVDADALDCLFSGEPMAIEPTNLTTAFEYAGVTVVVSDRDRIVVSPADDS
jgi:hypothetical protein